MLTWLAREKELFSSMLPESDLRMLRWKTRGDAYEAFVKDHPDVAKDEMPSYSYFANTWHTDPHASQATLACWPRKMAERLWARNCDDAFFAQEAEEVWAQQEEQDAILAQEAEELWAQKEEHAIFAQEA